jgi:hypothetical protein
MNIDCVSENTGFALAYITLLESSIYWMLRNVSIAHTDIQIIIQNGEPAFVVIPYKKYLKIRRPFITNYGESVPH